ncbi:MAG: FkbM family methyltransferase [Sulfuricaulis sp.]
MLLKLISPLVSAVKKFKYNVSDNRRISYSQSGEDLIIEQIFTALGRTRITYLDLGANHPTRFSNTYLLYHNGNSGVCVEPDPTVQPLFSRWRGRDILLTCGVGLEEGEADFYVMTTNTLSTFSKAEAERYQSYGRQKIAKVIKLPLKPVSAILQQHFSKCPNLVSLDIESMDFQILQSMDLNKWRPEVFCIETLTYTEDKTERKLGEIIEYMRDKDYLVYGDTFINTIFVDTNAWQRRK